MSEPYKVFNGNKFLEDMNEKQAFREAHENAVLIHNGDTYIVREMNIKEKRIYVKKQDVNFHTQALKEVDIKNLKKEKEQIIVAKNVLYNKLEKENEMLKNESMQRLRDKLDLKDKYVALMAENEKLKLDCEKLQHGYIDTDMIFCGGRQNGKQYTFLVELFKKIPKDKVQAAYVVAYKESLIWCTSQPSIRDQLDSLIEENRAFMRKCVDEWLYGPPTKREEMWEKILGVTKCSSVEIKVAKQDITTFLRELQDKIPEVRWNGSDCLPVDLSVPDWFKHDYIYFSLFRNYDKGNLRLCYDDKPHSWVRIKVDYFSPMRWDLFKKGRLIVKVNSDNYEDFYNKCEIEIGRKPFDKYSGTFTVYYKYEKELEEYIFHTRPYKDVIPYAKRVVDWEDVR